MNISHSFKLSDWKEDFFPFIHRFVKEKTASQFENALLVFPTSRAKQVCLEYMQTIENNTFLPQALTVVELIEYCEFAWLEENEINAKDLDSLENIFLLYSIVTDLAKSSGEASEKKFLASLLGDEEGRKRSFFHKELGSFDYFYQYGVYLDDILQECFEENSTAFSLKNTFDVVDDFSSYLLSNLRAIALKYIENLKEKAFTTQSFRKYLLAQKIEDVSYSIPRIFTDKQMFFCGIDMVKSAEELCFRYFAEQDCYFLFTSDPMLAEMPGKAHWSTGFYKDLAQRWNTSFELISFENSPNCAIESIKRSEYFFHQAFDIHSQFQSLDIEQNTDRRTACVLNTENSLLPLLYTLNKNFSDDELNVALGYPLSETKVFQLINLFDKMKKNARLSVEESLRDLLDLSDVNECLNFPYFPFTKEKISLELAKIELPFINPENTFIDKDILELFSEIIFPFFEIESLFSLHTWIEKLSLYLSPQLVDVELERLAILRMRETALTWLSKNYTNEIFSYDFCLRILLDELNKISTPFKYHSDDSLQVLLLSQTKNLQFDTVHIFDANDEFLPSKRSENPLLPEKLRPLLGLKNHQIYAYPEAHQWYRLLASAKTIHIYWQESSAKSLFDTKKVRSPFVEEVIWKLELENNALFDVASESDGNTLFTQADCPLDLPQRSNKIIVNDEIKAKLSDFLSSYLSSTSLDTFLECPLKFFYKYICKFNEVSEVEEADNYAVLGVLVHKILQKLYTVGKTHTKEELYAKFTAIYSDIDSLFEEENIFNLFPPESIFLLKKSLDYRIRKYIASQPDEITIIKLEEKLEVKINNNLQLRAIIDRVDKRINDDGIEEINILDYKTGSLKKLPTKKFWEEGIDYFEEFMSAPDYSDDGHEILADLYKELESVQLPLYYYTAYSSGLKVANAGYIELFDSCEEKYLIDSSCEVEMQKQISIVLNFLRNYMENIQVLSPHKRTKCDYCSYKNFCF